MFFLHHTNVDRIFSIWQDCHDYDQVPQHLLQKEHYVGDKPTLNGIDVPMPYRNGTASVITNSIGGGGAGSGGQRYQLSPRALFKIKGNSMVNMEYGYVRDSFCGVIDQKYGKDKVCKWHWFEPSQPTQ
eukprot:TRINITY_DN16534_c0_g1_i1.p1 TRINITY_DN16534_c0_g1~~TRINITY_DN16534_c0_g1_i1.p1  ORF type:complete len:129 (+),score=16.50 TRINITY_DN16534_c0_g1_i1:3-389(+)